MSSEQVPGQESKIRRRTIARRSSFGLLLAFIHLGCSGPETTHVKLVRVSGFVKLDGKPLKQAVVVFESADGSFSYAQTNNSGRYDLQFDSRVYGTTEGKKTVRISLNRLIRGLNSNDEGSPEDKAGGSFATQPVEEVPDRYHSQSILTVDVAADSRKFNFELSTEQSRNPDLPVVYRLSSQFDDFSENVFRISLLTVIIVQTALMLALTNGREVAASVFRRRDEGFPLSVLLGLLHGTFCSAILAYIINPEWMEWGFLFNIPIVLRWIGLALLAVGMALVIWGFASLRHSFTLSVTPSLQASLITSGPYRWTRHPLYTAFLVEAAGISLLMASWPVAIVSLALFALAVARTRIEEELLVARFGNDYRSYMDRTGKFLPRAF